MRKEEKSIPKNNNCNNPTKEEINQFLLDKERADTASGARVIRLNQEVDELEKKVQITNVGLRLLL